MRALIVDYGGVLTGGIRETMARWLETDGVDPGDFETVLREWLAAVTSPVHALERGELAMDAFERDLAGRLRTRDGGRPVAVGLLARMFAGLRVDPAMVAVVRRVHTAGVRTALLSNSWGMDYPRDGWPELFDAVVLSGEVGMRKPEPGIYRLAAGRLAVPESACVFVDDLPANVQGATDVGMTGVLHRSTKQTTVELEALLGLPLRSPGDRSWEGEP